MKIYEVKRVKTFYIFTAYCLLCIVPSLAEPKLVDVLSVNPTIVLDIRYATENNFTHHKLYPVARCLLRRERPKASAPCKKN